VAPTWLRIRPGSRRFGRLAVLGAGDVERVAEGEQQRSKLLALIGAEAGEQGVLGVALGASGGHEVGFAGRRERDDVAAAVGGVALPGQVAPCLEGIEQRDEDAGVDVHHPAEVALAHGAAVMQEPEELELARREVVRGVHGAQTAHRLLAEQREQQPRARRALVENALA
jgi:hypothetical protein